MAGDSAIDPAGAILVNSGTVAAADLSIGGSLAAPLPGRGTISATAGGNILISDAMAVWSGSTLSVDANSSVDVGTSGIFDAGNIVVENGHSLAGDGLLAASVDNLGTLEALGTVASNVFSPGTLEITGSLTGVGTIELGPNSVARLDGPVAASQSINFTSGGAELILAAPGSGFAAPITNLNTGDRIEFNFGAGVTISKASVTSPGTVTVVTSGGDYVMSNVSFAAGSTQVFFPFTDFNTGFATIQVTPGNYGWTGKISTDLGTAGNWQNFLTGQNPAASPPDATINVGFNNNASGTTSTLTGSASAIGFNFSGPGAWLLSGATLTVAGAPSPPFLPFAGGFNTNVTLDAATLTANGSTSIGSPTGATVTAQGGSHVTTSGDSVGPNAGQSGSLVLTGLGTTWTEQAGPAANGSIPGFLSVGFSGPSGGLAGSSGFLTVTSGAVLNTGAFAVFGGNAGSVGSGTISAGGTWNARDVGVGQGGAGTLTVDGGTVAAIGGLTAGAVSGGAGTLSVADGTVSATGNLQVGSSGTGAITIGAGGTVSTGGTFSGVGINAGSNGSLQILNGGTYQSTVAPQTGQVLNIGLNGTFGATPAAIGSASVSGLGSLLNLNGNPMSVGNNGGTGSLTVAQGGTVEAGTPDSNKGSALQVGRVTGGTGNIVVTDPNSLLSLTGFVLLGQAGTGTLLVENGGSVAINNAPTNGAGFFIGSGFTGGTPNVGGSGQATVTSNGKLTAAQNISIGGNGANGTLSVDNGGLVLATTGFTIANAATVGGTLYGGAGLLDIGAGGVAKVTEAPQTNSFVVEVGASSGSLTGPTTLSSGTVDVSGAGALLDTNGNGIEVGRLGNGILTVSQGGSVVAGTQDSNVLAATAIGRLGDGSLTVDGPGSTYTSNGFSYVGRGGTGSLAIENQGKVIVGLDSKGSGSISFGSAQGSATSGSGTTIQTGGSGTGLITGGGDLFSQQNISVGSYGASGSLTISTDGTAEATGRVLIGNTETFAAGTTIVTTAGTTIATASTVLTGNGTVDVEAGSVLKSDGPHVAGQSSIIVGSGAGSTGSLKVNGAGATVDGGGDRIGIGADAQGSVIVSQGGAVTAGTQFSSDSAGYVGGNADGTGSLTVTDPGSTYTNIGQFAVGASGTGHLLIENQGSMFTGNSPVDATQGFEVGQSSGSTGDATVTGNASLLRNTGRFIVGDGGHASLSIDSGGTVITTPGAVAGLAGAEIAAQAGSDGANVTVSGAGSDWQIGGTLLVGELAAGTLSITSGATVTAGAADLGPSASGTGTISLSGAGSELMTSGALIIGDQGSAQLSIGAGATVNATGGFSVGLGGVVTQSGGVLDPAAANINLGSIGGVGETIGDIDNGGSIYAANGVYEVAGNITTGTGQKGLLIIDSGASDLVLDKRVDAGQSASFTADTGTLTIGLAGSFAATIFDFAPGDVIQATGASSGTFDTTTDVLALNTGAMLQFSGNYTDPSLWHVAADGTVSLSPPCFMAGTRISAERGELAVENLSVGDRVQVIGTGPSSYPIIWIGWRTVDCTRHPDPRKVWPVRIAADAFGPGRPVRDLYLSPNHSIYFGDVLIPAKHLINGSTIAQVPADEVTYYHVELAQHAVLLAEGLPAESYLDIGDRSNFANGNGAIALYPDFASRVWDAAGCAPLVVTGPSLEAARRWVNGLAGTAMQAA
ncbi:MAG TPA: Hint domain-containing protein [Acetobacteraceae bacterium]